MEQQTSETTLFVVDDDAMWRYLVSSALRDRGFEVSEFDGAHTVLDELSVRRPALALVDAVMPGVDGFELCRRIRASPGMEQVPVLIVTGLDDESSISKAYEVGASDFFLKSTHWTLLAERIRQVLRQTQSVSAQGMTQSQRYDELTGLPTRRGFLSGLELLIESNPHANGEQLVVLMLDLDRFRSVNESLGLQLGDQLLALVAARLESTGPRLMARLMGDKFALAYGDRADESTVAEILQRVRAAISCPFEVGGQECFLSASIGLASHPEDSDSAGLLLSHAEAALGEAKQKGRNQVFRFIAREAVSGRRRLDLNNALHRALERDEISLQYQPVLDCRDGGSWSVEALMRWRHEGQWISPVEFIPIAEESGLIVALGEWAIRQALRQLAAWRSAGYSIASVAVNVPAMHLGRASLESAIRDAFAESDLSGQSLVIELTESGLMDDFDQALAQLRRFDALGIQLAIDDFGTGYSSLSRLTRLPTGTLKIDRSFVHQIGVSREDTAVVKAIVALASGLAMDVIAEGVETEEQLVRLREIGCMRFQGFLFSRPRPASEIGEMSAAIERHFNTLLAMAREPSLARD